MTRTQEQLQETVDELEVGGQPQDPYAGPSSELDAQLQQLGPGDHAQLAALLRANRDNQQYILSVAVSRCGNATVQRAMQLVASNQAVPSQEGSAMAMDMFREENGPPAAAATYHQPSQAVRDGAKEDAAEVAVMPAARTAWEQGAIHYNAAHQSMVDEFNALTSNACVGGDATVDPQLIATWQRAHGIDGDGRVGPHTLAAAKKAETSKTPDEPAAAAPTPTEDEAFDDMNGSAHDSRTYE